MEALKLVEDLRNNINQVFVGKADIVEDCLTCILAEGHVLLEDVPGVGKTTLALALSGSMDASFGRIQFTPDTLPSDVFGVSVYDMKSGEFSFRAGVVMNQIILADEINRTSPKTQSSLLEAMAEQQVTVDGKVYPLPQPFFVIATQNPVEFMGTYPLPEAQLDRFMMRLSIGYPDREDEIKMTELHLKGETTKQIQPVCKADDILKLREEVQKVTVKGSVLGYIQDIVRLTREEKRFVLGASPRAMIALTRASQARAFLQGRDYVKPDDVKAVAKQVLTHRLALSTESRIQKVDPVAILEQLIAKAKIPM